MQTRAATRLAAISAEASPPGEASPSGEGSPLAAEDVNQYLLTPPSSAQRTQSTTNPATKSHQTEKYSEAETLAVAVTKRKRGRKTPTEPVRGGWDVLPHNLGQLWTPNTGNSEVKPASASVKTAHIDTSTNPADADAASVKGERVNPETINAIQQGTAEAIETPAALPQRQLRPRAAKIPESTRESVQGPRNKRQRKTKNFKTSTDNNLADDGPDVEISKGKSTKIQIQTKNSGAKAGNDEISEASNQINIGSEPEKRNGRAKKDNKYGFVPGLTPYPDHAAPTEKQCEEVYQILVGLHDDVKPLPPDTIPAPSLEIAGCGEVPSVLDGLIRTVLSGSTTFESADLMLRALVAKYGVIEEGVGKGSVDWNKVRKAPEEEVYATIKKGGLAGIKSKVIKGILQMVYDENMERRAAYLEEKKTGLQANVTGASVKTTGQKDLEILKAEQEMLFLDHLHGLETGEAIKHFIRYHGVGVKTAACVTLFSLQRPCFAVDTHVFRMARWLRWVPEKTSEDKTFYHLEVRCPDHLKYGLHQLFIRHGKTCDRCSGRTSIGTKEWDRAVCPLENLLDRFTKRQAKPKGTKEKKAGSKGKKKSDGGVDDADSAKEAEADDEVDVEMADEDESPVSGDDNIPVDDGDGGEADAKEGEEAVTFTPGG